jgi:hypothetical protein
MIEPSRPDPAKPFELKIMRRNELQPSICLYEQMLIAACRLPSWEWAEDMQVLLIPLIELERTTPIALQYKRRTEFFLISSLDSITVSTKVSYIIGHKYDQARLG